MEEVIFHIGEHIFGTDMIGRNGVYCLKRLCVTTSWTWIMESANEWQEWLR